MRNKVIAIILKILLIIFLVGPFMLIGLVTCLSSLVSGNLSGLMLGATLIILPLPLLVKRKHKPEEKPLLKEQQTEFSLPKDAHVIFCTRCGGAMDSTCKYCRDCGALLKHN